MVEKKHIVEQMRRAVLIASCLSYKEAVRHMAQIAQVVAGCV